ncbi:hypothetical protein N9C10_01650 [Flavobacteriaceae bacterium]|nr:hypothetical protein [Flavobacteriaceae bacterium]
MSPNYLTQMIGDGSTMNILTNKTKYRIGSKPERQGVYFFYLPALKARPARNLHITIPDNLNINRVHVTNGPVGSNDKTAYYSSSNHGEFIQRLQVVLGQEKREWEEYKLLKGSSLKFARYLQERVRRRNELLEARQEVREEAAQKRNRLQREAQNKLQRDAQQKRQREAQLKKQRKAQEKLQRQAQEQLTRRLKQRNRANKEDIEKFKKLALKTKRTEQKQSEYNRLRNLSHIKQFMAKTTNNQYNFVRARTRRANNKAATAGAAEAGKQLDARLKRGQNILIAKKLLSNFDPNIPTPANFARIINRFPELSGNVTKSQNILEQIRQLETTGPLKQPSPLEVNFGARTPAARLNNFNSNTLKKFDRYYVLSLEKLKKKGTLGSSAGEAQQLGSQEYINMYYNYYEPIHGEKKKRENALTRISGFGIPANRLYNYLRKPNTSIHLIKNLLNYYPTNTLREIYNAKRQR